MNWDKKGDDLGARGAGAYVTAPLAMGKWTSWAKEMMVVLAFHPYVGSMLTTGEAPMFTPPSYQRMEMVEALDGTSSMQPVIRDKWVLDDGITRYRATVRRVMDSQAKFEESMGRIAATIWGSVGADVRTRVEMSLGAAFSKVFNEPDARGVIKLWRACQEASTGAGSDSACAFTQSVLSLSCAQNGVMAYAAEFAARKHDLLSLVTTPSPPGPGMTDGKLVRTILNGRFILELMGKDPVTNQMILDETTKAIWSDSEDITVKITQLKNTADRFALARRDHGVLQANVGVLERNGVNLSANAAAVGARPRGGGACFNCAKPDHNYGNCPAPTAKCGICGEPHLDSMHATVMDYRARAAARGQSKLRKGKPGGIAAGSPADRSGKIRAAMADLQPTDADTQYAEYEELRKHWPEGEAADVDLEAMSARLAEVEDWGEDIQASMVRMGVQSPHTPTNRPVSGPFSPKVGTPFGTSSDYDSEGFELDGY